MNKRIDRKRRRQRERERERDCKIYFLEVRKTVESKKKTVFKVCCTLVVKAILSLNLCDCEGFIPSTHLHVTFP